MSAQGQFVAKAILAAKDGTTRKPMPEWLADIAAGGTSIADLQAAWTAYTPALTGGLTAATATGRYKKIGRTLFLQLACSITTVGTGDVVWGLPPGLVLAAKFILTGGETAVTGKAIQARGTGGFSTLTAFNYDGTSPAANGAILTVSGVVEVTT